MHNLKSTILTIALILLYSTIINSTIKNNYSKQDKRFIIYSNSIDPEDEACSINKVFEMFRKSEDDSISFYKPLVINFSDESRTTKSYDTTGNVLVELVEVKSNGSWIPNNRTSYLYDFYQLKTKISENYVNGTWENVSRNNYTYNENGLLVNNLLELWGYFNWVNKYNYSYAYDANWNLQRLSIGIWSNGDWLNSTRYTYTHDSRGNILSDLFEKYTNGSWINNKQNVYTYDDNDNLLTQIYSKWTNNSWLDNSKYTYSYNTNGKMLTFLTQVWEQTEWINSHRITSEYSSTGFLINELTEIWGVNDWEKRLMDVYTYDEQNYPITKTTLQYSDTLWTNANKTIYNYTIHGYLLEELFETYTDTLWTNYSKATYSYDANDNCTSAKAYLWQNASWVNSAFMMLCATYNNNQDTLTSQVPYLEIQYAGFTNIDENSPYLTTYSLQQNYPNPFNPSTSIKFTLPNFEQVTLKIYDVLGKEVTTLVNEELSSGNYTKVWNAIGVSSGVYFCKLQAGRFSETKKMILLR